MEFANSVFCGWILLSLVERQLSCAHNPYLIESLLRFDSEVTLEDFRQRWN